MAERTIFQKIWDGEVPSYPIYRNERYGWLAMLDVYPATVGHTLVVPQEAVDQWVDLPDDRLAQAAVLGKIVGRHMQQTLQPLRVTRHTIGFGVPHIHDQYVPSYVRGDTAYLYSPERMKSPAPTEELRAVQEKLCFSEELRTVADAKMMRLAQELSADL